MYTTKACNIGAAMPDLSSNRPIWPGGHEGIAEPANACLATEPVASPENDQPGSRADEPQACERRPRPRRIGASVA